QDRGPLVEGGVPPRGGGVEGNGDGAPGVLVGGVAENAEHGGVAVRLDNVDACPAAEAPRAADSHGVFSGLVGEGGEVAGEFGAFRAAGRVGQDRLVDGCGNVGHGVHGCAPGVVSRVD